MNKVYMIFIVLISTILITSCGNNDKFDYKETWDGENYFSYPQDMSRGFYVDNEGNIYYKEVQQVEANAAEASFTTEPHNSHYTVPYNILHKVDFNGNNLDTIELGKISLNYNFIIHDNKLYYTSTISGQSAEGNHLSSAVMYEFDLFLKKERILYIFDNYSDIKKLALIDNVIYFLAMDTERLNSLELMIYEDNYVYNGEVIAAYNIHNNSYSELSLNNPVAFSVTADNNLLIYAHDEQGYFFTKYDINNAVFSEKAYRNLGKITEFSLYNNDKDIIFNNQNTRHVIQATSIIKDNGISELMPDVGLGGTGITCCGGYVFYYNALNNKVERLKISAYTKKLKTINLIYTQNYKYYPFGCGYTINSQKIDDESFAISVLSRDKTYDIYLMDSREDFSENIKNKGAFYSLNKVAGVKEYIDTCFPYVQAAAYTPDQDIWMLPIALNIPCLIYNEDICKENSLDLTQEMDYMTFLNKLIEFNSKYKDIKKMNISEYIIIENIFYQYLRSYDNFDSELFREYAGLLKENINYIIEPKKWHLNQFQAISDEIFDGITDNFLFQYVYEYYPQQFYSAYNFRICGLPKLTDNKNNVATCLFICVNPDSKNLKETLNYISDLCYYLLEHNQAMIFNDRYLYPDTQYYDDLYTIYSNAEITFTPPNDVFSSDFDKYMSGIIDLEAFIKEANKKLDMYRNE